MLTGNLVRVRYARNRIVPCSIDPGEVRWQLAAEQLLDLFRGQEGRTRGELEEEIEEAFGGDAGQLVHRGLAKLLEDRCEFEVVSGQPPEKIREVVFRLAARERRAGSTEYSVPSAPYSVNDAHDGGAQPDHSVLGTPYSVLSTRSSGLDMASQRDAALRLAAIELEMT